MRVLVTDAQYPQALAVAQSLGRQGVEVCLVDVNPRAAAFASLYCRERHISPPPAAQDAYLEFLLGLVRRRSYDFLITCADLSTWHLSCARTDMARHVRFVLPAHDVVETALHKDLLMQFADRHGLPIPRTCFPTTMEEVRQCADAFDGPMVVKAVRGAGAYQVRYASRDTIAHTVQEILGLGTIYNTRWPIIQAFIPGTDVVVYALCDAGEVLAMVPWKCVRSYPLSGGNAAKAVTIQDADVERLTRQLVKRLGWHGIAGIGFRLDQRDGRYRLLELNPRFSAATRLAIASGVDLPALFWRHFAKQEPIAPVEPRVGACYQALFPYDVLHAAARPRALGAVLKDALDWRIDHGVCGVPVRVIVRQIRATWRSLRAQLSQRWVASNLSRVSVEPVHRASAFEHLSPRVRRSGSEVPGSGQISQPAVPIPEHISGLRAAIKMSLGSGFRVRGCRPDHPEPPTLNPEPERPEVILTGALSSKRFSGAAVRAPERPTFSVILATRNRAQHLREALERLAVQERQDGVTYEVVVVDNGSTDHTAHVVAELAARFPVSLRYLYEAAVGRPYALNTALRHAQGEFLAFTDDDMLTASTWLSALWRCFMEEQADGVGGRVVPLWMASPPAWLTAETAHRFGGVGLFDLGVQRLQCCETQPGSWGGGNIALRRSAIDVVGFFNTRLIRLQATEYYRRCLRHSLKVVYEPAALAHHKLGPERMTPSYFRRLRHTIGYYKAYSLSWTGMLPVTLVPPSCYRRMLHAAGRWVAALVLRRPFTERFQHELVVRECLSLWAHRFLMAGQRWRKV